MTTFFPDVSGYNGGLRIPANTAAVCARATLSDRVADAWYAGFRQQAATLGALFFAYHWLNHGNIAAQAKWCFQHVGGTPLMIDAEDVAGNTGYAGPLTVQDILDFATAYRALGGVVHLVYLPHWYWQNDMGSPDLRPLATAGLALVSSNYATYSDTGPGWASYGGMTPVIWQYTDKLPYGGQAADFNAYRGTVVELRALISGTPTKEDDMTPEEHQMLKDLHDRSNWAVSPATVTADQAEHGITPASATGGVPVPGSMLANLDALARGAVHLDDASVTALSAALAAHPAPGTGTDPAAIEAALRDVLPGIRLSAS